MGPFCQFFRETDCNENCSIDYHNTPCVCTGGNFDETVCETSIQCNADLSCFIETPKNCSRNIYSFNINDFCDIQSDIFDVRCEYAGNLYFKLLLDKKRRLCTSALNKSTAIANCECKTCAGIKQSSCSPMVATYCSCISPHENPQIATTSNIQSTTESPGSVALIGGVIGGIAAVAIVVLLIFVALWFRKKQSLRRRGNGNSSSNENEAFEEGSTQFRREDPVYVNEELSDTVEKENKYYELKPENEAFEEGGTQFRKRDDPVYANDDISDTVDKENKYYELKPENIVPSGAYDSLFLPGKISRPEKDGKYVNIDSDHNQIQEETSNRDEDDQ